MSAHAIEPVKHYRLVKPILQAYSLGLLSTTSPQILSLLISATKGSLSFRNALIRAYNLVAGQLGLEQFPAACAILIGGTTLLPSLFWAVLGRFVDRSKVRAKAGSPSLDTFVKFVAAFVAALTSFTILNRRNSKEQSFKEATQSKSPFADADVATQEAVKVTRRRRRSSVTFGTSDALHREPPPRFTGLGGRTLSLTFFAIVRALDIIIGHAWDTYKIRRPVTKRHLSTETLIENLAAPTVFALSSGIVMFAWFFAPDRLPRTYNTWIASAAQIDARLIEALRQCRFGNFVYGKDTGLAPLLGGMCRDLNLPIEWGDPAKTVPVPCELYHSGTGPSCEWHAITRFARAWKFAMRMYLPLNLIILLRQSASKRSSGKAVVDAAQSSAFLGAFVALFYYGVCCARTRVGPKMLSSKKVTAQMWDGGLCVATGCLACGWSILLEKASRRAEIAFFVGPRAIATLFPRRYERSHIWKEKLAFAISLAFILTTAQTNPWRVRGVFGRLLKQIL